METRLCTAWERDWHSTKRMITRCERDWHCANRICTPAPHAQNPRVLRPQQCFNVSLQADEMFEDTVAKHLAPARAREQ